MNALPEAHALRSIFWQLFATLTFGESPTTITHSLPLVFAWLRNAAGAGGIHFKRLLWVLRFEIGPRGDRGHFHLCLAGIPQALLCGQFCRSLESAWRTCGGGLSAVALYDPARDGVGYILKLPPVLQGSALWPAGSSGIGGNDCEPMLSKSLFSALRRGRM